MNTIKVRLVYYGEEKIELEFYTRDEEFEEFIDTCKDLDRYIVERVEIDDIYIRFLNSNSRVTEFVKMIEQLECLTEHEVLYLGAYEEEFGIKDLKDLKGLIEYDLFNYPFYANMTLVEVADEILDDYKIPYFISQHIDMDSFYDTLAEDGYKETNYGVIVR